jgi:predicted nucleic acid-binding protein
MEAAVQVIIDTSALLAVILNESHRDAVLGATAGVTLCAPASLPWEIGNALSASLKRRRFSLATARAAVTAFERIPVRLYPVDLATALELAGAHGIYAYDAYLLATAQAMRAPLLTLDGGLRTAAERVRISLVEV